MQVDTVSFGRGKPANGALLAEVLRAAEKLYHGQTLHIGFADTLWPHWISKLKSVGQVPSNQNVDSSLLATNSCFFFAPSPTGCLKGSLRFILASEFLRLAMLFLGLKPFFPGKIIKIKVQGRASSNIFESRVEIFSFRWVLTQNQWGLFEGSDRFRSGKFTDKFRPGKVRGNPESPLEMPGNSQELGGIHSNLPRSLPSTFVGWEKFALHSGRFFWSVFCHSVDPDFGDGFPAVVDDLELWPWSFPSFRGTEESMFRVEARQLFLWEVLSA